MKHSKIVLLTSTLALALGIGACGSSNNSGQITPFTNSNGLAGNCGTGNNYGSLYGGIPYGNTYNYSYGFGGNPYANPYNTMNNPYANPYANNCVGSSIYGPNYNYVLTDSQITGAATTDYKAWTNLESQLVATGGNFDVASSSGTQASTYFYWNNGQTFAQHFGSGAQTPAPAASADTLSLVKQYIALGNKLLAESGVDSASHTIIASKVKAIQNWLDADEGNLAKSDPENFSNANKTVKDSIQTLQDIGVTPADANEGLLKLNPSALNDYIQKQVAAGQPVASVKQQILSSIDQVSHDLDQYLTTYGHSFMLVDGTSSAKISIDAGEGSADQLAAVKRAIKYQAFLRAAQDNVKSYTPSAT